MKRLLLACLEEWQNRNAAVLKTVVGRKVAWVRILLLPLKKCKVAQWKSRGLLIPWLQVRVLPLQLKATLV